MSTYEIDGRTLDTDLAITCGEPRPAHAPLADERAVDVPVTVYLPGGATIAGEVTLTQAQDGRPVYEACGAASADCWVSGALLGELHRAAEGKHRSTLRTYLEQIDAAASAKAGRPPSR